MKREIFFAILALDWSIKPLWRILLKNPWMNSFVKEIFFFTLSSSRKFFIALNQRLDSSHQLPSKLVHYPLPSQRIISTKFNLISRYSQHNKICARKEKEEKFSFDDYPNRTPHARQKWTKLISQSKFFSLFFFLTTKNHPS